MTSQTNTYATDWLSGAGLRPTRQRMALAELLVGDGRHRHVTAESLFEAAKAKGAAVSLATVYNTLHQFKDVGLLREVVVEAGRSYFDTNTSEHHHFFSETTGELIDIPADAIEVGALPSPPPGTEIDRAEVVIRLRDRQG